MIAPVVPRYISRAVPRYLAGRERVLGGRWLHGCPDLAAMTLIEALGQPGAERWARDLLAEVEAAA